MRNYIQKLLLAVFITLMFLLSLGKTGWMAEDELRDLTAISFVYTSCFCLLPSLFFIEKSLKDTVNHEKDIYYHGLWNQIIFYDCS